MKNWKTTVGGVVAAIGAGLQASDNPTYKLVGQILLAVGVLFFGVAAKDNDVTGK